MSFCKRSALLMVVLSLFAVGLCGCATANTYRVGSYNIRCAQAANPAFDGANCWNERKSGMAEHIRGLNLDVLGLQEVTPMQMRFLQDQLGEFEFVGEHRGANRKSDEASPVAFRKERFAKVKSGTFWLSPTPEVPGVKGWGAACPRVCSYVILRDRKTGKQFCFANTHTDHISELAREKGMLLIIDRMKDFGKGAPIVFTGDHNCRYDDKPAVAVRALLSDCRDVSTSGCKGPRNTFHGFGKYPDGPVVRGGKHYKDYCIDYIYVTPGTRVLDFTTHDNCRGEGLFYSDHYAVTATIGF